MSDQEQPTPRPLRIDPDQYGQAYPLETMTRGGQRRRAPVFNIHEKSGRLPPAFAAIELLKVTYALVPLTERFRRHSKGPRQSTLWTGFRRSRRRGALGPVRPVTLRRHLLMALPLSKSPRN